MMTAVSTTLLSMTKPKLPFSIDALMGNEEQSTYCNSSPSPIKDYSIPKSRTESKSVSPQPVLVPIPTFPVTGPSSSRDRPSVFSSGLYQRTLPQYPPGLDPSLAGMLLHGDPYQTFPWYLQRPRFLQHRFGPGPDLPGFLLPPFRKAKRIRTAFSASQLMKLEGAFDKNHYVTGNERKQLAESLGLTETQVKVWFQNRRTKAKRQVIEDRERCEKSHSLSSSKGLDPQHYSTLSEPNLSPPERRDESLYDDEDSDDLYTTDDRSEIKEH